MYLYKSFSLFTFNLLTNFFQSILPPVNSATSDPGNLSSLFTQILSIRLFINQPIEGLHLFRRYETTSGRQMRYLRSLCSGLSFFLRGLIALARMGLFSQLYIICLMLRLFYSWMPFLTYRYCLAQGKLETRMHSLMLEHTSTTLPFQRRFSRDIYLNPDKLRFIEGFLLILTIDLSNFIFIVYFMRILFI